ncbi:DUF4236 domain-containing protein [Kitasatospora sp. NPDC058218]|uniref:DUF4236 domain-containing protein n=1 Tax=Kitasatospora sp. NPDC058218 TaxID=3346385 RepID=UPI0036D7C55A
MAQLVWVKPGHPAKDTRRCPPLGRTSRPARGGTVGYRKSFKAGGLRVTASKSGISYSAGVKGARVTKQANGRVRTTVSVPGTGISHSRTTGGRKAQPRPATAAPQRSRRQHTKGEWISAGIFLALFLFALFLFG